MSTLDTLNTLAYNVAKAAADFNTAVAAARDAQVNIDIRIDYEMAAPGSAPVMGTPKVKGVVVTASLPLPLPV